MKVTNQQLKEAFNKGLPVNIYFNNEEIVVKMSAIDFKSQGVIAGLFFRDKEGNLIRVPKKDIVCIKDLEKNIRSKSVSFFEDDLVDFIFKVNEEWKDYSVSKNILDNDMVEKKLFIKNKIYEYKNKR